MKIVNFKGSRLLKKKKSKEKNKKEESFAKCFIHPVKKRVKIWLQRTGNRFQHYSGGSMDGNINSIRR